MGDLVENNRARMRSEDERLQKATGNDGETTSKESIRSSNETKSDANRIVDSVITVRPRFAIFQRSNSPQDGVLPCHVDFYARPGTLGVTTLCAAK